MDLTKLKKLPFSDEDYRRIEARKNRENGISVDPEWFFIAKFGKHFGWDGIMAILRNEISMEEANMLMAGANKVDAQESLGFYTAVYTGVGSAFAKNGGSQFKNATATLRKQAEVQE